MSTHLRPNTTQANKILVIGPAWVGDMVMSQSLYQQLAATRPGVVIDVVAPPWSVPLLARMPQVRRAIELPIAHGELGLGLRRRIGYSLRAERYEQAIVLPNSFKSALLPWFAQVPLRTGWRGEMRYGLLNDLRVLDGAALPRMVQRFVALAGPPDSTAESQLSAPNPQLSVDKGAAAALAADVAIDAQYPILALCPGAEFGGAKRWPSASFAEVAKRYLGQGWQVMLFGSAADAPVCAEIEQVAPACTNLAGRTSLAEAIDLLSLASAVVTNDSGLMHVAAALGRPLVALYGPTSADFTPPLHSSAQVVQATTSCAPCFQRECPLGHHDCMRQLSVDQVAQTLEHSFSQ